jgi:hypothetical protein
MSVKGTSANEMGKDSGQKQWARTVGIQSSREEMEQVEVLNWKRV